MKQNKQDELIQRINKEGYDFEFSLDPTLRKQTGSYYTSLQLTLPMAKELIENIPEQKKKNIQNLRFLEPCVGTGNFVFAYILVAAKGLPTSKIRTLLNNVYACDINKRALKIYKSQLKALAKNEFGISLDKAYFDSHVGSGLLFDVTEKMPAYVPVDSVFGKEASNSFDIIMTNPPYKNLKAELGHYASDNARNIDKKKYDIISKSAKNILPLTSSGTLNLYKLFVEEILTKYAASDALISLLIPTSILSDKTCEKIRSKIINDHHIISLKNIAEKNSFINAQQSLVAVLVSKRKTHSNQHTSVCKTYSSQDDKPTEIDLRTIANKDNGYTILLLNGREIELLKTMSKHPKIKDLPFITNLRGELDLTFNKSSITKTKTNYKMLRGRNIGYYKMIDIENCDYVTPDFVDKSSKKAFICQHRIACQQISNIAKERRLTFTQVPENFVLANSCNFLVIEKNKYNIDLNYLTGLLNSKLMNWYFKIHSSNNHINNYEINNFPIPISGIAINDISKLVASMGQDATDTSVLDQIDQLVTGLFSNEYSLGVEGAPRTDNKMEQVDIYVKKALNDLKFILPKIQAEDVAALLDDQQTVEATVLKYASSVDKMDADVMFGIIEKYRKLRLGKILNHTTFKLSDLDMEMIQPIPQGGNWKNIPKVTVAKSKRLTRITETGGRTTLYGRLHYQKPSYTITTYFNRPGNGAYVHPKHHRVLSVREAARFQAFPENYYFFGNKTQLLKQIGNAVPTLLAYQIGQKIVDRLGKIKSLDLFSGAGGLTVGLKQAGIKTVLCTDFDRASCTTIKINNPEAEVILGDITDPEVKKSITQSAIKSNADLVCGGPPCQGFSLAGFRNKDDPRNQLFKEFVSIVESTNPKVVLFENVQGILTFNGGETYDAIHQLFSDLGYKTEGRLLSIDRYGVPQKRKRVIIICTRKDININPSELYPDETTTEDHRKVTVADTIMDLESIDCSEDAIYHTEPKLSEYNQMLNGTVSPGNFLHSLASFKEEVLPATQESLFQTN